MHSQNFCPICFSNSSKELLNHPRFAYFSTPVSENDKSKILEKFSGEELMSPLEVLACNNCYHCYLKKLPDQKKIDYLYSNFYHYPSPLRGHFKPERDDKFLQYFERNITPLCKKNNLNNVLEVGCFDGYIIYNLQKKGFKVMGCDPSDGAIIAQENNVNVLQEFFDYKKFLKKGLKFDIVISRHFIEHVISPRKWIFGLKKILNPGGIIIIETPNIFFYLKKGLVEGFSLQHLQGFSSNSLIYSLSKEGLKSINIEETSQNLIVFATQGESSDEKNTLDWESTVDQFYRKFVLNTNKIENILLEYVQKKRDIGMWGAGGFGLAALTLYNIQKENIRFIVDSDPKKWGLKYIDNSIPIISPEKAKSFDPDLLIVSSMYSESIMKSIIGMRFKASILQIFPEINYKKRSHN